MAEQWYPVASFVTEPGQSYDLSPHFNTPGVADPFRENTGWQLAETHYSSDAVVPIGGWSGAVNADGSLGGAPSSPVFTESNGYPGYMELQVSYNPDPTRQCTNCPPPKTGSQSCTASPQSKHSVELASGRFVFNLPLLSIAALGAGQWSFDLNYYANFGIDGIAGRNFNYPQFDCLNELATIGHGLSGTGANDVELVSSGNTREVFAYDYDTGGYDSSGTNTACSLVRSGTGAGDQFTLTASNGTVSTFFGFDSAIATPGQLQSITDRYGNTLTLAWASAGGVPQLQSVTDGYGRTINCTYYGPEFGYRLQQIEGFPRAAAQLPV